MNMNTVTLLNEIYELSNNNDEHSKNTMIAIKKLLNINNTNIDNIEWYRFISDIKLNDVDNIYIAWSYEDVKAYDNKKLLTDEAYREILSNIYRSHDCTLGITWDTIEFFLQDYYHKSDIEDYKPQVRGTIPMMESWQYRNWYVNVDDLIDQYYDELNMTTEKEDILRKESIRLINKNQNRFKD